MDLGICVEDAITKFYIIVSDIKGNVSKRLVYLHHRDTY